MAKYNLLNEEMKRFEVYEGSNIKQMPKLIADGRVPMNVAQLMQRRLDVRNSEADIKSSYLDNYFDTGDTIAYHPDGRVKIILDSQTLRDITPQSELRNGALVLTEDAYHALQGEEFKKGKLGKVNESLSRADVKAHPVWKALVRDQTLLNDYADYIFAEGKQRFSYDTAMGVYPDSASGDAKMRAWFVSRLEYGSCAYGWNHLGISVGRFLGIAPEAPCAAIKGGSNIRAYTIADLQAFDQAVKGLEAIVRPELLEPFSQLRKKL